MIVAGYPTDVDDPQVTESDHDARGTIGGQAGRQAQEPRIGHHRCDCNQRHREEASREAVAAG